MNSRSPSIHASIHPPKKEEKTEDSDWLINKGTHREPIRLEELTGHVEFDRYNENKKCINQSTSNWTFGQNKRG